MKLFAEITSEKGKSVSKSANENLQIELKSEDRLTFLTLSITLVDGYEYPVIEIMGIVPEVLKQIKEDIEELEVGEIEM